MRSAGAIYWAGIGRLVYGLSEHRLRSVTGNHPENPTLDLLCRDVFRRGRATEVVGPLLEDEAEAGALRRLGEVVSDGFASRPSEFGAGLSSRVLESDPARPLLRRALRVRTGRVQEHLRRSNPCIDSKKEWIASLRSQ